jgi:hypothetical protein
MAQLFDVRGNPFRGALDAIVGETITDARSQTVSLAALNATTQIDLNGACSVLLDMRSAAFTGTVVFETTVDGTNWGVITGLNGVNPVASVVGAGVVLSQVDLSVTGSRSFRVRVSAYTSGTLTVAGRATFAEYSVIATPFPASLNVTATAVVNTAVTLTIPAAPSFFHYITRIQIKRFFVTAGLAGTTPTLVTTTNIPGTPAFSFGTSGAIGSTIEEVVEPALPIKSTTLNTATTIVCPASTDSIWRVNVSYALGI